MNIYTLSCIDTGYIYYVGATKNDLSVRFRAHKYGSKSKAMMRLLESGVKLRIDLLDTCQREQTSEVEFFWMSLIRSWGFCLLNSIKYHKYPKSFALENILNVQPTAPAL